jgi:uncharacterized protein YdeI (YjbR/CyaY-like superfamily)
MIKKDPRIDAYIARAAEFAQPILRHVRKLVHRACPEVEETIKWSFPHFDYHGIMLGMAAFKEHCAIGFWKGELILGKESGADGGMGHFGKVTSLTDLPGDEQLLAYIRTAARLNRDGVKKPASPVQKKQPRQPLTIPADFGAALKKNKQATATFENSSYSHKKEYLEWITEAKREETRRKRIETSIAWLAEGKPRNWKYMACRS